MPSAPGSEERQPSGPAGRRISRAHSDFDEVGIGELIHISRYYHFGDQRVALRRDGVVYHLAGDHVGTTSLVLDANGNPSASLRAGMTSRRLQTGGATYTQGWDYKNRLASVTVQDGSATFIYDGDGALVKKVAGGLTTVYVGSHYEKQGSRGPGHWETKLACRKLVASGADAVCPKRNRG